MAKPVVTEALVFTVADQLHAAGTEPTIILVQERIGGGSYTTIKRYLDAWKQQQLTIQQKDLLIEQQQTVIQQQLLTGTILVDSVRDAASEHKHHEEPLLGGTVALSRVEKSGIIVDLAEMYRKLRRFFADENDE